MTHETHAKTHTPHGHGDGHPLVGHLVPWPILAATAAGLLFLTWLTVSVTFVNLGVFNLFIAMFIATVKATMVCMYFMHLRWDNPFNILVFVGSLAFVTLFVCIALMDTVSYGHEIQWTQADLSNVPK